MASGILPAAFSTAAELVWVASPSGPVPAVVARLQMKLLEMAGLAGRYNSTLETRLANNQTSTDEDKALMYDIRGQRAAAVLK